MPLFDAAARYRNLHRSLSNGSADHFLIDHVWDNIIDRLNDIRKNFSTPLLINARGATRADAILRGTGKFTGTSTIMPPPDDPSGILPIEPGGHDAVISIFDLHVANDPLIFLKQLQFALAPGGVCLIAMLGGETLHQARMALLAADMAARGGARPRVHPMLSLPDLARLMQQTGFTIPVVDQEKIVVEYQNLDQLWRDIRAMGETNILSDRVRTFSPRGVFHHSTDHYATENKATGKIFPATFNVFYAIGWVGDKPHGS